MKFLSSFFIVTLLLISFTLAENIGYIVEDSSSLNNDFIAIINEQGYSYDVIDDSEIQRTNFSLYDMILIGDESLDNYRSIPVSEVNSLIVNSKSSHLDGGWGIADYSNLLSSSNHQERGSMIVHEVITQGLESPVRLYNDEGARLSVLPSNLRNIAPGFNRVVISESFSGRSIVGVINPGERLYNNKISSSKIIYFGIVETQYWTDESKQLFRNSLNWLIGVDEDEDGYYAADTGGDDCDDSDALVNPGSDDVMKNCVNDVPVITGYSPTGVVNILENVDKEFSISVVDDSSEGSLGVSWFVDSNSAGSGLDYVFNKVVGDYELKAVVSDGEFNIEKTWDVHVKDSSFFSCSDIGGLICSGGKSCSSEVVGVSDSTGCCLAQCIVQFSDINQKCEVVDDGIKLSFISLNENKIVYVGEEMKFKVKIENDLDEKDNFDLKVYLYDTSEDVIVERSKESVDVNNDEGESVDFVLDLPYDLDEENDYAVYVYVAGDESCNEDSRVVDVRRKEHLVVIDELNLDKEGYSCGDYVNLDVEVLNIGSSEESVFLKVSNSELGLSQDSGRFDLEEYGEDDSERKNFNFKIPEDVDVGEYKIRVDAQYGGRRHTLEGTVHVKECVGLVSEKTEVEAVRVSGEKLPVSEKSGLSKVYLSLLVLSIFWVVVLFIALGMVYYRRGFNFNGFNLKGFNFKKVDFKKVWKKFKR